MVDILHRVGIEHGSPEKVYDALTTVDGLTGWWTDDTKGSGDVGGRLEFRFPPVGGFDMEGVEARPAEKVVWRWPTARGSGSAPRSTGSCARTAINRWATNRRRAGPDRPSDGAGVRVVLVRRRCGPRKDSRPRCECSCIRSFGSGTTTNGTTARPRLRRSAVVDGRNTRVRLNVQQAVKKIGFLSFGHWSHSPHSQARSASDVLLQSIDLAVAAEEFGVDGAYFRVHHFARQLGSPFPLLAAVGARTNRIEIGTGVIDMRYENPLYMAEDSGAADLIAGGRLELGISRGSPEQVVDGFRHFGYGPPEGQTMADVARTNTEVYLQVIDGARFAEPNPRPMFPNPHPGPLPLEPQSPGLRERIWWGSGSNATGEWAAKLGMNLMSSTLKEDESGKPFHVQQAEQIEAYRAAWREAGHERTPRVSVSRSIFALVTDEDRAYFGADRASDDSVGHIDGYRAVFGRSYAAEPDVLIEQLAKDDAIAAADTLLLTVPNQLGVDYNVHVLESILTHVAPGLGWR